MAPQERNAWQFGIIAVIAYVVYLWWVLSSVGARPITEVEFAWPMIWTILGSIAASITLSIIVGILRPKSNERPDARDREIARFGDHVGQGFVIAGALAAMLMAMAQWPYFWIANVVYLAFVLSAVLSSMAKIAAYREGFQPW